MPLRSLPRSKKGFYVATPLVGSVLFLTAAILAAALSSENDGRNAVARSSEYSGKLQFIGLATLADSYDVLLQNKLEGMTADFMKDDYFSINPDEQDWKQSFKSGMESYYVRTMGETLRVDIEAYGEAYGNMPGVDTCKVENRGEVFVHDLAVEDSGEGDSTVMARGSSFGEVLVCTSKDPEGTVVTDIYGRYYKISMRVPALYDVARWAMMTARAAINSGTSGIAEPVTKWEGPKWAIIKKADNLPVDPAAADLGGVISKWKELTTWLAGRLKDVVGNEARNRGYQGIAMTEFNVTAASGNEYTLNDFEVACADDLSDRDQQSYRNCMPFRVSVVLGDKECGGLEPPRSPSGQNPNPIYNLQTGSLAMKCGDGPCPQGLVSVMSDVVKPLGSACLDYYGFVDSVYPVCKVWKAKPRSLVIKSAVEDDNKRYVRAGEESTVFKFKEELTDIGGGSVKGMRLTCDESNPDRSAEKADDDVSLYKSNVRIVLQNLDVKIGAGKDPNSAIVRWADKGSNLGQINDENLREVYRSIYGPNVLPTPCLGGTMRPSEKCSSPEMKEKPRVLIEVDWDETRAACMNRANDLCSALCGGRAADDSSKDLFCRSVFPEADKHVGAKGRLVCSGGHDCEETYVEITSMTFGVGGTQE